MSDRLTRLHALGLTLPEPSVPLAAYVPVVRHGSMLIVSGQLPLHNGKVTLCGHFGGGLTVEQGQAAARIAALNMLAHVAREVGGLDRVKRVMRLGGFIASLPSFTEHAKVMNGASDLMEAVFLDAGRHARSTVGVSALPLGAAVEVEGLFAVEDA